MENSHKNLLFVLGAGASIASANLALREVLGNLSMDNFLDVMFKMYSPNSEGQRELMARKFDFKKCGDIFIFDNRFIDDIKEISKKENERNISKLHTKLQEDFDSIISEFSNSQRNHSRDISPDNNLFLGFNLIEAVYQTVSEYYRCFERRYYHKLFEIVRRTKAPVISLNWDINFETVIFENTGIHMKNYYGATVFDHLEDREKDRPRDTIVEVLKPHGSLNQYFLGGPNPYYHQYGGNLPISEYHLCVSDYIGKDLYDPDDEYLLIPPIEEKHISELNNSGIRIKFQKYGIRKVKLIEGIFSEIRKIVKQTNILIIIGYSFPEEDKHILKLFEDSPIEKIVVFDKNEEVFKRICKNFSNAKRCEFKTSGFEEILEFVI